MLTKAEKGDPRSKRTRQLLTQAFVDLLKQKAFQSITVQDIAARATVNRATFYAHFEDKHALLNYAIRHALRQRLASQLPEQPTLSQESLQLLTYVACEFMAEFHRHCLPKDQQLLPLLETSITAELYDVLLSWLKGRAPGQTSRRAAPDVAAMVASWAIFGAASQWSREKRRESATEYVGQVVPLILAGLRESTKVSA